MKNSIYKFRCFREYPIFLVRNHFRPNFSIEVFSNHYHHEKGLGLVIYCHHVLVMFLGWSDYIFEIDQKRTPFLSSGTNFLISSATIEFILREILYLAFSWGKFLKKWRGFPEDQNSWEPEENLSDSIDKLNDYMKIRNG